MAPKASDEIPSLSVTAVFIARRFRDVGARRRAPPRKLKIDLRHLLMRVNLRGEGRVLELDLEPVRLGNQSVIAQLHRFQRRRPRPRQRVEWPQHPTMPRTAQTCVRQHLSIKARAFVRAEPRENMQLSILCVKPQSPVIALRGEHILALGRRQLGAAEEQRLGRLKLFFHDHVFVEDMERGGEGVRRPVGAKPVAPFAQLAPSRAHGDVFAHQVFVVARDQPPHHWVQQLEIASRPDRVRGHHPRADFAKRFPSRLDDQQETEKRGVVGLPVFAGVIIHDDHRQRDAHDLLQINAGDDLLLDAGGEAVDQLVQNVEMRDVLVIPVGVVRRVVSFVDEHKLGEGETGRA